MSKIILAVGLLCAAIAGCKRETVVKNPADETFASYADLPGLKGTHDPSLKAEYALLVAERATPKLLDEDAAAQLNSPEAVDLREVLTDNLNTSAVEYALSRTDRMFDGDELRWESVSLMQASQFGRQYEKQRAALRESLTQSDVHLAVQLSQGVGMNIEWIDAGRLYHRLEVFRAADEVVASDLDAALQSLQVMFQFHELLGAQKHVVARLSAARCRREALSVMQAIVSHSSMRPTQLEQLRQMIAGQLAVWPRDADAWIGDRAQGLHMYEMIRDGQLYSVLTQEEFSRHVADRSLEAFAAAATRTIDSDESFYLRSMRSIIAACERPYHQRDAAFNAIRGELEDKKSSPEYPLIADQLLLMGVEEGQQQQALDRAWVEAWANALALAIEDRAPPFEINPASGREYQIEFEAGRVIVSRIDPADVNAGVIVPLHRAERVSRGLPLPPPR